MFFTYPDRWPVLLRNLSNALSEGRPAISAWQKNASINGIENDNIRVFASSPKAKAGNINYYINISLIS